MSNKREALVLGATGLVGGRLLQLLLKEPAYSRVYTVSRRPLTLQDPKLESLVGDFEQMPTLLDGVQVDDVFCCLGTTMKKAGAREAFRRVDFDYPLQAAKLTKSKAEHFLLVSALGANSRSPVFYNRVKGEIEAALEQQGFRYLTILRPSLLLGERQESRFLEAIGMRIAGVLNPLLIGPLRKYAAVSADDVAATMLSEALRCASGARESAVRWLESDEINQH